MSGISSVDPIIKVTRSEHAHVAQAIPAPLSLGQFQWALRHGLVAVASVGWRLGRLPALPCCCLGVFVWTIPVPIGAPFRSLGLSAGYSQKILVRNQEDLAKCAAAH